MPDENYKPTGTSLRWTAIDLAAMAVVTPELRRAAASMLAGVGYNERSRKGRNREFWILLLIAFLVDQLRELARAMAEGELDLGAWQRRSGELVRVGYVAAAYVGAHDLMVKSLAEDAPFQAVLSVAHATSEIKYSLSRLERFARMTEAEVSTTDSVASAVARGEMYARYAKSVYGLVVLEDAILSGKTQERNVLGRAEHCRECVALTALGWRPIGTIVVPGKRICAALCKCRMERRRTEPE